MKKSKKTIKQIVEHYAKHFEGQTFLDTTLVTAMLKRNGHDPKLTEKVSDKAMNLYIKRHR